MAQANESKDNKNHGTQSAIPKPSLHPSMLAWLFQDEFQKLALERSQAIEAHRAMRTTSSLASDCSPVLTGDEPVCALKTGKL
ncbi:hypothetical protein SFA35_08540 [Pseudomonas sp. HR96]|uniref:hypothetical protein n=1 Tax=Pseudomonas sp. HR96 TaxID=1027966 RepID=UPI002A753271|nr:hypothetical protein [Pseudomonas sp. HR96]WPP01391.1 hypothetical protein SFA35_08540 [Pseudomonas sp. HR96]